RWCRGCQVDPEDDAQRAEDREHAPLYLAHAIAREALAVGDEVGVNERATLLDEPHRRRHCGRGAAGRKRSSMAWLAITLAADPGISLPTPARHEPLEAQRVLPHAEVVDQHARH